MADDVSRKASRLSLSALGSLMWACASTTTTVSVLDKSASGKDTHAAQTDRSRCEYKGRDDRYLAESAGLGARALSVRRVYLVAGERGQRRRVLICREADTNLDGIKDLARQYDDQGEAVEETADANYDGVIDTWIHFSKGRVVRVDLDHAFDGQPDETRYYVAGKLTRIEQDTNRDGKVDIWEIYLGGHLDRMGVDDNYDGRVDRWNRDAASGTAVERSAARNTARGDASIGPKTPGP
ncbi:MAG: hypothetical protein ABI895_23475 [Deltaproteobacteria bacterium]